MKNRIILLFSLFISLGAVCQDDGIQTLLNPDTKIRGFGGPLMSFTVVNGEFAHIMGGGGGILLDDKVFFGGFGGGMTNNIQVNNNLYEDFNIQFGYGGLWIGYIHNGSSPFHPVASVQFGWGGVSMDDNADVSIYYDGFFVLNPTLELEMNLTQFMRAGIGGSYRLTGGVNLDGLNDADFSGPEVQLNFKFGWF